MENLCLISTYKIFECSKINYSSYCIYLAYVCILNYNNTSVISLAIIGHPANNTFCEGTDATLSCIVYDNSTGDAANTTGWINDDTRVAVAANMITNTRNGDVVTSVLTIVDVSLSSNGTRYFCIPIFDVRSFVGVLLVTGEHCIIMSFVYQLVQ